MSKIKEYEAKVRNDKHVLDIGVLVRANNSLAFSKHGFMIVSEHIVEGRENYYNLYSQKELRYWKMRCWLGNSSYTVETPNTENDFPKSI